MRHFEMQGRWWIPETPDKWVPGVLSHSPSGGVTLVLQGDVAVSKEAAFRFVRRPVIWGESEGIPVTVRNASSDVVWFNQEYQIPETYIGGHFSAPPRAGKLSFQLSDLDSFVGANSSFVQLRLKDPDEKGELFSVPVHAGTIRVLQDTPLRERVENLELPPRTHVEVTLATPLSIRDAERQFVFPLQRLVALGTTENTAIVSLVAETEGGGAPIEVIFAQRDGLSRGEDQIPDNMLFNRYDLDDPAATITAWLQLSAKIPHVLHLFFDYAYFRRGDLTGGIVHVVQSLEGFHRDLKKQPQYRIAKRDFDLIRDEFKQALEEKFPKNAEYSQWLSDTLNSGATLVMRLNSLFDANGDLMRELVSDRDAFVMTAKKFRNAFAHGLAIDELSSDDQRGLFFLMEKLSVLFRACLMEKLGMDESRRNLLFRRNLWFQHLRRSPHLEWASWRARTRGVVDVPEE